MKFKIIALGGDGIGPEIMQQGLRVLQFVGAKVSLEFDVEYDLLHGASWDVHKTFCTNSVLEKTRSANAVRIDAVGRQVRGAVFSKFIIC